MSPSARKIIFTAIRVIVSAGIILYIFTYLIKPSELAAQIKNINIGLIWKLFLLCFIPFLLSILRWAVLLRALGLRATLWEVFRIGYIGIFFNSFMIGATGGDLVKAVIMARITDRKVPAIVSIFVDRVVGLVALALVGTFAVLYYYDVPALFYPRIIILGILLFCAVFVLLYFNRSIRESRLVSSLVSRLPLQNILREIDHTIILYNQRKKYVAIALLISILIHTIWVFIVFGLGKALGEGTMSLYHYFAYVPIAMMANSLPISLGGIGVQEYAFIKLFSIAGVAEAVSGAIGILLRVCCLLWTLPGGIIFIFGTEKIRITAEEKGKFATLDETKT